MLLTIKNFKIPGEITDLEISEKDKVQEDIYLNEFVMFYKLQTNSNTQHTHKQAVKQICDVYLDTNSHNRSHFETQTLRFLVLIFILANAFFLI